MHAAKIPFTGMIVSSLAVACIMLIAYHIPSRAAILKATVTVAFFKLMLSPHSPPTAHIAVFFQGYLGYVFFNHRKHFLASAIAVAMLALVESSMQRLLVLLVIYGNTFWEAFDIYIQKIIGGAFSQYTFAAAGLYVLIHAITGLWVAITVVRLIQRSENLENRQPYILTNVAPRQIDAKSKSKKKRIKHWLVIIWIIFFGFYLQAIFDPANAVLPVNKILRIVVRSLLIILTWYLLLAPLAMILIKRLIKKQEQRQRLPIAEIQQIIPDIKQLFLRSWQLSASVTGIARIRFFMRVLFINIVHENPNVNGIK